MWYWDSLVGLCVEYYKCLCTPVRTCATLFVPKFDTYMWPLWPWKVGQTQDYSASTPHASTVQIWWRRSASCRDNADISIFMMTYETRIVGQGDLVFGVWSGALVGLGIQDYKSLCTSVTICVTLVVPKCFLSILTPVTPKR